MTDKDDLETMIWAFLCALEELIRCRDDALTAAATCPNAIQAIRLYAMADAYTETERRFRPVMGLIPQTRYLFDNFPTIYGEWKLTDSA